MSGRGSGKLGAGEVVEERWLVVRAVGTGSFGDVYEVEDLDTSSSDEGGAPTPHPRYAIKTEPANINAQILKMEVLVLKRLNEANAKHCCRLVSRGRNSRLNYLVMTLTGRSLSHLRKKRPNNTFSLSTVLRVSAQCLEALEEMHEIGFIHRDIKPGNFAIDKAERRNVLILDFGLARSFLTVDRKLRPQRPMAGFRGTVRFAPISSHEGKEMGRKDDLESWWYQHRDLAVGSLPWSDLISKSDIEARKRSTRDDAALFLDLPAQLRSALDYIDLIDCPDKPDYPLLHSLLNQALLACPGTPITRDSPYDWH